jgi:ABC-type cobalamin/Fe3+-siderophores transport system ATPase subunit
LNKEHSIFEIGAMTVGRYQKRQHEMNPLPAVIMTRLTPARTCKNRLHCFTFLALLIVLTHPLSSFGWTARPASQFGLLKQFARIGPGQTQLHMAKPKKSDALAALEALETLEAGGGVNTAVATAAILDEPLSKKELMELEKKKKKQKLDKDPAKSKKEALLARALANENDGDSPDGESSVHVGADVPPTKAMSKAAKLLEMERIDEAAAATVEESPPKLSKRELKELQKKAEKEAAKLEKKKLKKLQHQSTAGGDDDEDLDSGSSSRLTDDEAGDSFSLSASGGDPTSDDDDSISDPNAVTLEDKIRKERPPPRIRVMENSGAGQQPNFVSIRMENVGVIFRNQQVLKDVTWGVSTGDGCIGLVGKNGAGKSTQLRILSGELEPTTGDVVKSSQDIKISILRQEFIDELTLSNTLREELMSVFTAENAILTELKKCEDELATLSGDSNDTERMQVILDRMQDLQNEAENKNVYALTSRVQKVMDLMGFTESEGDDLVASFSGGWKMRIGLGKVLLQDPTILLLDEPSNHLDLESINWLEVSILVAGPPILDTACLAHVCFGGGSFVRRSYANKARSFPLLW